MPPLTDLIRPARVHEATGPGRQVFALALAGALAGPVLWVQQRRARAMLCPQGVAALLDPARLILVRAPDELGLLQVVEEALRSGAAPLVVAEVAQAPDLTASRRLQLAAGAGGGRGLCLVPEGGQRGNAAETRWRCTPLPGRPGRGAPLPGVPGGPVLPGVPDAPVLPGVPDAPVLPGVPGGVPHLWELVKNKRGRLGAWVVDALTGADSPADAQTASQTAPQTAPGTWGDPAAPGSAPAAAAPRRSPRSATPARSAEPAGAPPGG